MAPFLLLSLAGVAMPAGDPAALAETYVEAVRDLNEEQVRKGAAQSEAELAARLPEAAAKALAALLAAEGEKVEERAPALAACGAAALDLDRIEDFERVRARLAELDPARAGELGIVLTRERFQMRGLGGMEPEGLTVIADVLDLVLDAYAEVFGFTRWSKVPGKKLRVRVHLEERIERPPHFAPQFPWHSEIDFPVIDARAFASPTQQGQFQFYGLCHELGHVIAMWGDRANEEDHHAWAHYTGVTIVEHLSGAPDSPAGLEPLRDVRWRSLTKERAKVAEEGIEPGFEARQNVLALLIGLHDLVGPRAIGEALTRLEDERKLIRVNHVRYYAFRDLRKALLAAKAGKNSRKELEKLFGR